MFGYKPAEGAAPRSAAPTVSDAAWANMWRKAFHAVLCWLTLSKTSGEAVKTVLSSSVNDNVSAESAPRLYRNVPIGVYASAAPYAAYSFHVPFVTAPKAAASRIVPVINNANGYLRDSYGNRFVETPQTVAYKTAFPQQFLPLQELPAHLAQPLVTAPNQAKQMAPHYFVGSQFRVPTFQVAQHPSHSFAGFSQPFVFNHNVRNLAPSPAVPTHTQAITTQQQPSSSKAVYTTNLQPVHHYHNEVKFQRLEQRPTGNQANTATNEARHTGVVQTHEDKSRIQAAPATITAVVNGKKTVVNIDTKPPVPLLDLSLLEPLTFANPLVPQVQHFLPRINEATYHKLPEFNANEGKVNKKEYSVSKTKSYDTGVVKAKAPPKKKSKQPKTFGDGDDNQQKTHPVKKPNVTIKDTPVLNESPEITYEINAPNYKETYKEKSISYNKATEDEPNTYTYDEKTQSEPITYSYTKTEQKKPVSYHIVTSKNPEQIKHVITYQGNVQKPKPLIYQFKPEEQVKEQHYPEDESSESGSTEDASDESSHEGSPPPQSQSHESDYPHSHNQANQQNHHNIQGHGHSHSHAHHQSHPHTPRPGKTAKHHELRHNYNARPDDYDHQHHQNEGVPRRSPEHVEHRSHDNQHHRNDESLSHRPKNSRPNENHHYKSDHPALKDNYAPYHSSQEIKGYGKVETQYPVTHEFEDNLRILPSVAPASNLKGNQDEGDKDADSYHNFYPAPLSSLEQYQKFVEQQKQSQEQAEAPPVHRSPEPVIHEQAKRIIIQEESPEEMRVHQEQNVMAEVIDDDGNNEEEFEKAYKNAAYGFQAFDGKSDDRDKDVYNPANYGFSREHDDFQIEKNPFQEYQAEGDQFPKSTRADYKDARDNTKENYFTDYSINQPESMADLYQNKANYYKLYKKFRPEKYFAGENDKKEKKSGKYTVAPSFDYNPAPETKQNYFAEYKAEPIKYEYKFAKESPRSRDSSAHASRPYQRYKSKTNFVEPQFQYGFEPIALPKLLDSELAAMASNDSPESEKPGMRKKIYKENWYIKKTSTSGGKPS